GTGIEHRHARRKESARGIALKDRMTGNGVVGGAEVVGGLKELAVEEIKGEGIVENGRTGADHRLALAKWIPSQADTRTKIIPIGLVGLVHGHEAGDRVIAADAVAAFADHAVIVPADPSVQSEVGQNLIGVLNEKPERILVGVALRGAVVDGAAVHVAGEE